MTTFRQDVDAVSRTMSTRPGESGEISVQTIGQTYATSVEDLWDAVTNSERLPRWFAPVSGDLVLGGRYQVEGNAGGTIQTCEPPSGFSATWEFNGVTSWIAVTIREDGDGARLELEHTAALDPDDEEQAAFWAQFGPGATGVGWDLSLLGLGLHLGSGAGMDPAAAEAWAVSPEGVDYISRCSMAWAAAAIAAGTPRDQAEAAAARTTAFYTGQPDPTAEGVEPG